MTTKSSPTEAPPLPIDIRRLVLRAVLLPLLLMSLVAGCLAWQVQRLSSAAAAVQRAERVVAQANDVQKLILDQETGLRAFVFTGDRIFLQPYEEAHPAEAIEVLAGLVQGSPEQVAAVADLRRRYQAWRAQAAAVLAAPARSTGTAEMLARKVEMDALREAVAGIIEHEETTRAALARAADEETQVTAAALVIALAGLGGVLSFFSRGEIRQVAGAYEDALARRAQSEAVLAKLVERERLARERAQDALRAKDEFLSTLSHELRTPLTAILGWSGVLAGRKVPADTADRAIAAIERNAKAQAQIVDDILDVSRIVAGKFQLRLTTVDLGSVVRAALDVVRFSAESKGVTFDVALEGEPIQMLGDPDRLQQVVWNLLSNAVKFTPRGGRVEVRVDRPEGRARIRVRDTGEGIAPEFLPHVFERFRQADSSLRRAHGGLGLGLAIVQHLVDLHGGEVRAESEGIGHGAAFTITLPVSAVPSTRPAPLASAAPPPSAVSLAGVRALVVDDDHDSLTVVTAILREHGAEVESASSGAAALAALARGPVDVIVSDIGMPELDGYELLRKIRAAVVPTPALALSAYAANEDVERAHLAGFQRHLAKPVTPDRLVQVVAGMVRTS